jgi:hypothetical protein
MVTELIGYVASGVVAVSLMMSNISRLRWLNLAGSLAFAVYGILVHAYPVAAVNGFVVLVDAYYLWELNSKRDFFSLLEVLPDDKTFLSHFLRFYGDDIKHFFPEFRLEGIKSPRCVFILRNLMPVGLFIYEDEGNGSARIHLDYVIGAYRDLRNSRFLFHTHCRDFLASGFKEFVFRAPSDGHEGYLKKMGFTPSAVDPAVYVKPLACGSDFSG